MLITKGHIRYGIWKELKVYYSMKKKSGYRTFCIYCELILTLITYTFNLYAYVRKNS